MDASKPTDVWKTASPAYAVFPGTPPPSTATTEAVDAETKAPAPVKYVVPMAIAVPLESHAPYAQPTPTTQHTAQLKTSGGRLLSAARRIPLLLLFHVANFALGLAAFILVVTLVPLSVGLLPLCCVGIVVFRITAWVAEFLAIADIALANLVAHKTDETLRVHPRIRSGRQYSDPDGDDDDKDAKHRGGACGWLQFVTPQNLGAMLYFATLKFAIGVLSCIVFSCAAGFPMAALGIAGVSDVQPYGITYDDHPVWYVLSTVGATLLGLVLLPFVAALSWKLTRFACAERRRSDARSFV